MFAVILSAIVGFYCIARAYSLNEKFSLFVGVGFLTITIIDFLHATLSFEAAGNNAFLNYFIPQTWFAGRTFLGVMLVVAVVKYAKTVPISSSNKQTSANNTLDYGDKKFDEGAVQEITITTTTPPWSPQQKRQSFTFDKNDKKNSDNNNNNVLHRSLLFSLIMLALLAIFVVDISFFTVFPGIITPYPISRPYEIPAFILFSVALFYFYKKKLYRSEDVFYRGMLGALIIDIFGQIIMSYSFQNFHTAHNVAHILKDSAYFIIVISLVMSSIQHNKIAKERAEIIRLQYLKLKEKDKMKDEFINIAAHELRTPIQPVLGMSQLLRTRLGKHDNNNNSTSKADEREMLDINIRNAKRLQKLTENILDVTKIESHSLVMRMERIDLYEVIMNAIDDVTASCDYLKKHKDIAISYVPRHIFVEADKNRLMQVISNLLSNSVKFTSKGSISITVQEKRVMNNRKNNEGIGVATSTTTSTPSASEDEIIISVQDTGSGIDPKVLSNLFSKFNSNPTSGGTGLGLFISKNIIEAHGGRIWASNNQNEEGIRKEGATFTFTLPKITNKRQPEIQLSSSTPSTTISSYYLDAITSPLASTGDNNKKSRSMN